MHQLRPLTGSQFVLGMGLDLASEPVRRHQVFPPLYATVHLKFTGFSSTAMTKTRVCECEHLTLLTRIM